MITAGITIIAVGSLSKAQAALITNISDEALSGGSTIDFEQVTPGSYNSITQENVTFAAPVGQVGFINSNYKNNYNTQGQSLQNTYAFDGFTSLKISFSTAVNAFGFNFGASDDPWTLTAFDEAGSILDTQVLAPVFDSNTGNFYGIKTTSLISYATLSNQNIGDYVFIDNFKIACR